MKFDLIGERLAYNKQLLKAANEIQASLAIRGFDYSRTQKPRITRDNCNFEPKLPSFKPKMQVLVFMV